MIHTVKEEVIEKLLDRNSAFDLYEQKEIIDEVIDSTEQVLRLHGVVRSVWLVQDSKTLINYGCFFDEQKAWEFVSSSDNEFAVVEIDIR